MITTTAPTVDGTPNQRISIVHMTRRFRMAIFIAINIKRTIVCNFSTTVSRRVTFQGYLQNLFVYRKVHIPSFSFFLRVVFMRDVNCFQGSTLKLFYSVSKRR